MYQQGMYQQGITKLGGQYTSNIAYSYYPATVYQNVAPFIQCVHQPAPPKEPPKETVLDSIKKLMQATPTVTGHKLQHEETVLVNADLGGF